MGDRQVGSDIGLRFVRALVAKDVEALTSLLHPQIEFRGLTPSRGWEASSPDGVREIVFGSWFEPHDHVLETLAADTHRVADRDRIRYRLRVESEGTEYLVEQQGYYDVVDGRIARMSLMCSGYRPWPDPP